MIKQNLIIYSIPILSEILKELENDIEYSIIDVSNDEQLSKEELSKSLILTDGKHNKFVNAIKLDFPIKISKLIEKINIQFIKLSTKEKSNISIGKFTIDLNARLLSLNSKNIFLTEKEINLLIFLSNSKGSISSNSKGSISINKLQEQLWGYKNQVETHTVETHIHRLRKKIFKEFKKDDFILSNKNGYYLNK